MLSCIHSDFREPCGKVSHPNSFRFHVIYRFQNTSVSLFFGAILVKCEKDGLRTISTFI